MMFSSINVEITFSMLLIVLCYSL